MQKEYEYTYKIMTMDLKAVSLFVEYKPTDANLTSYSFPIPGFIKLEDDSIMGIPDIIKKFAPHDRWEGQETLALLHNDIVLTSQLVEPTTNA